MQSVNAQNKYDTSFNWSGFIFFFMTEDVHFNQHSIKFKVKIANTNIHQIPHNVTTLTYLLHQTKRSRSN